MDEQKEEIKILSHEPWPGFKKAFLVALSISTLYLVIILIQSL